MIAEAIIFLIIVAVLLLSASAMAIINQLKKEGLETKCRLRFSQHIDDECKKILDWK